MKRLIIQTYIKDKVNRTHKFTYKSYPKLEQASRRHFRGYAEMVGADYEYFTDAADFEHGDEAHWQRWEMFNRPEYDEILYVDCDVLIHPTVFMSERNIFDERGEGVPVFHQNSKSRIGWTGGINCGVMKLTAEQCAALKDKIHDYYHPHVNQAAFNNCFRDTLGMFTWYLDMGWNTTHFPVRETLFRHYPGHLKNVYEKEKLHGFKP